MQYTSLTIKTNSKLVQKIRTLAMFAGIFCASNAFALPELNKVVTGDVGVAQTDAASVQVTQTSDKAIVNWNSFNVATNEKVHFQQPEHGICLNRIDAARGMSQIDGAVSATGKILLVNGAGILFSDTAQVDVGGLIAAASDITDANFLNDKINFDQGTHAAVINRGAIKVDDMAVLFGGSVANQGTVTANAGHVVFAAGNKLSFDFYGDGVLNFALEPVNAKVVADDVAHSKDAVTISGAVINDGGLVLVAADAVHGIFDNLINVSGEVSATTTFDDTGRIFLLASSERGNVVVDGVLNTAGVADKTDGGIINIYGENIRVTNNARLNASGVEDGGLIVVGTPMQFALESLKFPATKHLDVAPGAVLDASSKSMGDGGYVTAGSTATLNFQGQAIAHGGQKNGDGGMVAIVSLAGGETIDSSKVDISAPHGHAGTAMLGKDSDKVHSHR